VTFTYGNIINDTVLIPSGSSLGGAAYMEVNFEEWNPTLFDKTRLPATSTNTWSGGTPVPGSATCTAIAGTGGNCMVMEVLCFNSSHKPILPCQIFAPSGTLIGLSSTYQTESPQTNPALIIADDGQNNWADITTGYIAPDDVVVNGGTKGLNTDTAIVNVGCQYFSVGLNPSSVSPGAITIAGGMLKSCVKTTETVVITFTLEGPLQPNACGSTESSMFKTPTFTLQPNTHQIVRFPVLVPERTCAGTYNVVATTESVKGIVLGTSSASLTVVKHHIK
jgi:hypothetical protein